MKLSKFVRKAAAGKSIAIGPSPDNPHLSQYGEAALWMDLPIQKHMGPSASVTWYNTQKASDGHLACQKCRQERSTAVDISL